MEKDVVAKQKFGTRQIATIGMLSSISIILGITGLGFIPIPPVNATIMHIPVIIGAILEGPVVGAVIGLIFGIFSIIRAITTGSILLFAFLNPIVSVLPRILIGVFSYYTYKALPIKKESIKIAVGSIVGSLTNTVGFLGLMYLIYAKPYAKALNIAENTVGKVILGTAALNGIPEAIISAALTVSIVTAVRRIRKR